MDRRWRGLEGQEKFLRLQAYFKFKAGIPLLNRRPEEWLASTSDLYATYSNLHSVGRTCSVQAATDGSMHYVLTNIPTAELDEDSEEAGRASTRSLPQDVSNPLPGPAKGSEPGEQQYEVVVPLSTACQRITPALLCSMFDLHPAGRECILLALVDADGVVSVNRMHSGIVAPLEGPSGAQGFGPMQQKKIRQKLLAAAKERKQREWEERAARAAAEAETSEQAQRQEAALKRLQAEDEKGQALAAASRAAAAKAAGQADASRAAAEPDLQPAGTGCQEDSDMLDLAAFTDVEQQAIGSAGAVHQHVPQQPSAAEAEPP